MVCVFALQLAISNNKKVFFFFIAMRFKLLIKSQVNICFIKNKILTFLYRMEIETITVGKNKAHLFSLKKIVIIFSASRF